MKYIVKNCPTYSECRYEGYTCHYQGPEDTELECENNPDCLIKQVIEKCMLCSDGWSDWAMAEQVKADEILQLFKIEEINNDR